MLNIIRWKAGFEWAHIKRILCPNPEKKIYYFSFGANLSPSVLTRRRIKTFESFDYTLENAELRFTQSGFYRNHGYASADAKQGEVVYGKMYLILESDARRMDHFEGVPYLNVHEKVFHKIEDLHFFYYRSVAPVEGLKPTQEYLDYITKAYAAMPFVPKEYLATLSKTEVLEEFLPQNQTGKHIKNINAWPNFLHPTLTIYESCCLRVVEFLWNRSLFHWMVKLK